jgi:WD40 repeat protein
MSDPGATLLTVQHDGSANAIAFSPDSALLASGGGSTTVAITPVGPGQEVRIASLGFVADLAFSPDGTRLAVADLDQVGVFEVATGAPVWRGPVQAERSVNTVAFTPAGATIIATTDDHVFVLNAETGAREREIDVVPTIADADLSVDGKLIALAIDKRHGANHINAGFAAVIELDTGVERSRFTPPNAVFAIAFSPDKTNPLVLFGSADNTTRMIASTTGEEVWEERLETGASSLAFDPKGRWVVVGSADGAAIVVEAESGVPSDGTVSFDGAVTHVAFAGNGKWAACTGLGDPDERLVVFNAESGTKRYALPIEECLALRFSADSRWLGLGHFNTAVILDNGTP